MHLAVAIFEMKLKAVTVTEGRNSSFPICASLKYLSGTLTTSVSVGLVTNDISSFVHGEAIVCTIVNITVS